MFKAKGMVKSFAHFESLLLPLVSHLEKVLYLLTVCVIAQDFQDNHPSLGQ
jgi:hypothetical protein